LGWKNVPFPEKKTRDELKYVAQLPIHLVEILKSVAGFVTRILQQMGVFCGREAE
jgi:hypothetical protein